RSDRDRGGGGRGMAVKRSEEPPGPVGGVATAGPAAAVATPMPRRERWRPFFLSLLFLAPALILLGFLVVYPIFFSAYRSLYDKVGTHFVGIDNYRTMFTSSDTLTAIRNNALWLVGP